MNLFNYVLFLVCFYLGRSHGGGGGGHKIIHEKLRIHVPEFIKHGHHTKFIVIHHHPEHKGHHHHKSHHQHHKPQVWSFSHHKGHTKTHNTHGHSIGHGTSHHIPHVVHKSPKITHTAPMKHHVSKMPSHMVKTESHHDESPSAMPQIYGVQHVHKETHTYSSNPFGFSGARPSVPSHGYEVSEEPESADEDFGYQGHQQPAVYGNTYGAGVPHSYSTGVHHPFDSGISQNHNAGIPQTYGTGISQDYGAAIPQTGYGEDASNSIYPQEGFYAGNSDFEGAPQEEQYNEGAYNSYTYGNEEPAADFGGNTEHFSDEHKDFINTLNGNQQVHFADDTPESYSHASGFQTLMQSGGHETLVYK